jgi:hypothetical protein
VNREGGRPGRQILQGDSAADDRDDRQVDEVETVGDVPRGAGRARSPGAAPAVQVGRGRRRPAASSWQGRRRSIQDYRWTVQPCLLIAVSAATGRPGQRSEPWPGQPPGPGRMRATIPAVTMPAMNTGTTFGVIFTPSTGV